MSGGGLGPHQAGGASRRGLWWAGASRRAWGGDEVGMFGWVGLGMVGEVSARRSCLRGGLRRSSRGTGTAWGAETGRPLKASNRHESTIDVGDRGRVAPGGCAHLVGNPRLGFRHAREGGPRVPFSGAEFLVRGAGVARFAAGAPRP